MAAIAAGIEISTPVAEPDTEPERIIKHLVLRHPLGRDEQSHDRDLLALVTRKMRGIVFAREARIGLLLRYRAGEQAGHEFVASGPLRVVFDFILRACRRSAGGERQNASKHRGNERRTGWCHAILPSHLSIARHNRGARLHAGRRSGPAAWPVDTYHRNAAWSTTGRSRQAASLPRRRRRARSRVDQDARMLCWRKRHLAGRRGGGR